MQKDPVETFPINELEIEMWRGLRSWRVLISVAALFVCKINVTGCWFFLLIDLRDKKNLRQFFHFFWSCGSSTLHCYCMSECRWSWDCALAASSTLPNRGLPAMLQGILPGCAAAALKPIPRANSSLTPQQFFSEHVPFWALVERGEREIMGTLCFVCKSILWLLCKLLRLVEIGPSVFKKITNCLFWYWRNTSADLEVSCRRYWRVCPCCSPWMSQRQLCSTSFPHVEILSRNGKVKTLSASFWVGGISPKNKHLYAACMVARHYCILFLTLWWHLTKYWAPTRLTKDKRMNLLSTQQASLLIEACNVFCVQRFDITNIHWISRRSKRKSRALPVFWLFWVEIGHCFGCL